MVRVNLNALHVAKKLNKLKDRSNVGTYADEGFVSSDTVYYRRQSCKGWHSPAKILGEEGQCVLIRHRGAFYRTHQCRLMKVSKESESSRNEEKISSNKINEVLKEEDKRQYNKSPHCKSEELKDNTEKPCRNTVVEYKMNGSEEQKKEKIIKHIAKIN